VFFSFFLDDATLTALNYGLSIMLVTGADLAQVRVRLADYPFVRISADLSAPRISDGYPFFYVLINIP